MRLTCDTTLGSGCDNAGLVFGYLDADNYWVKVYSNADDTIYIYEISGGTWTQRGSTAYTITDDSPFTMAAEVRAGAADTYAGTVPSGQVGLWCSDSSDNDFDDFQVRDIAGPFEVDGRYFCSNGEVRTDNSDNNVIEAYGTDGLEDCIVRRAFRGDKFVFHFKFKWNNDSAPGCLVRWVSPGDYLALAIDPSDDKTRLYKRQSDGTLTTLSTAIGGLSLTTNTTYGAKVVIDDDPGDSSLQQLSFWVDTDGDSDYSDEYVQITSTAVDDVWSAGYVGLYRAAGGTSAQQYDDVLIGYDNNDDGDIADAGDDVQVADVFSSNAITLTYDNDGNLTADGLLGYVYDGWNRLVEVERSAAGDTTTVATYAYDGRNRRVSKVITNNGVSETPNDGGNATIHFYYCGLGSAGVSPANSGSTGVSPVKWNICETRNGSNQATRQWVWGTKYTDEILFMDVNGDPTESNDCDPDAQGGESTYDRRYFYHQDRNWNVVALTEYGDGVGTDARLIERYAYTPYGQFIVLKGDSGSGELANALHSSSVGNPFMHQGLGFDQEKSSYQNRHREYMAGLQQFAQRDPLGEAAGLNQYAALANRPTVQTDPSGQATSDTTIFTCACQEWAADQILGPDPISRWIPTLPDCPCFLGGAGEGTIPGDWTIPGDEPEGRWDPDIDTPDDPDDPDGYHPSAYACIRQSVGPGQPGQQCCYDDEGALITGGLGAGTPDKIGPSGWADVPGHTTADVIPWGWCKQGDIPCMYLKGRPPNDGGANNCTPNRPPLPPGVPTCR